MEEFKKLYGELSVDVVSWLEKNPEARELLREAPAQVRKVFGEETKLALWMFTPHDTRDYEALTVGIFATVPALQAIANLEKFEQDWYLDRFMTLPMGVQMFFTLRF